MGQPAALFQVLWTYYHLSPLLVWRYNQSKALELPWYFSLILTTITYFDGEQHWQSTNCRLYNHIRTVAFWLDAAPLLADLGLPFRVSALVYKLSGLINSRKGRSRRYYILGPNLRWYPFWDPPALSSVVVLHLWCPSNTSWVHGRLIIEYQYILSGEMSG